MKLKIAFVTVASLLAFSNQSMAYEAVFNQGTCTVTCNGAASCNSWRNGEGVTSGADGSSCSTRMSSPSSCPGDMGTSVCGPRGYVVSFNPDPADMLSAVSVINADKQEITDPVEINKYLNKLLSVPSTSKK